MKKILLITSFIVISLNIIVNILFYNKLNRAKEQISTLNSEILSHSEALSKSIGDEEKFRLKQSLLSFDQYLDDSKIFKKEIVKFSDQIKSFISYKDLLAYKIYEMGKLLGYKQLEKEERLRFQSTFKEAYSSILSFLTFEKEKNGELKKSLSLLAGKINNSLNIDYDNMSLIKDSLNKLVSNFGDYIDSRNILKKAFQQVLILNNDLLEIPISVHSLLKDDAFSRSNFIPYFNSDYESLRSSYQKFANLSESYKEQIMLNRKLKEEKDDLIEKSAIIERKVADLLATQNAQVEISDSIDNRELEIAGEGQQFTAAKILKYNSDYLFVVFDKGQKSNVFIGMPIVIKRQGAFICNARVTEVYESKSVAEIDLTSLENFGYPKFGDIVIKL